MELEIDKQAIPYRVDYDLGGDIFTLEFNYNTRFDFFTVDLIKDNELIIAGEKILYGKPLFTTFIDNRLPKVEIIPMNKTGEPVVRITYENFGETIVLLVGELNG